MASGAITLADITATDWSLKLGAIGSVVEGIADVEQCIAIILTTAPGADVLRPTFGAGLWRYLDYPVSSAIPAIVREASAAISSWEPRAKVVSVSATPLLDAGAQSGAQLRVTVVWQLKLGSSTSPLRTTTVNLAGGA